jgi:hypothetical protein
MDARWRESFAGLPPLEMPAVPLEVHLAEKLHALSVPRVMGRENSRVKDLVDVMLLHDHAARDVTRLRAAVVATFERRDTHAMPERFSLPLRAWRRPYRRFAAALAIEEAATVYAADERLHEVWRAIRDLPPATG